MRDIRITVKAIINAKVRTHQSRIDKFLKEANEGHLNYALHWYGENTLEATRFMIEARPFIQLIEKDDFSIEDLKSVCKGSKNIAMYFLKKGNFGANSTSAMSNLENIATGKVYGILLDMIEQIENELEGNNGEGF